MHTFNCSASLETRPENWLVSSEVGAGGAKEMPTILAALDETIEGAL
jgi:hypothetical protein